MKYSTNLRTAIDEIKSICDKYDIAASIILFSPSENSSTDYSEFSCHAVTSWSCLTVENNNLTFRNNLKDDFKGDVKLQSKAVRSTAAMLRHFADVNKFMASNCELMIQKMEASVSITNKPGEFFKRS